MKVLIDDGGDDDDNDELTPKTKHTNMQVFSHACIPYIVPVM